LWIVAMPVDEQIKGVARIFKIPATKPYLMRKIQFYCFELFI
jgi:hypothetical protein